MNNDEHLGEFSVSWNKKSDMQLVEILRESDDPQEQDNALGLLQSRYNTRVRNDMRRSLPIDLVDDAVQDVWVEFYASAMKNTINEGVAQYLSGITRNCRADTVNKMTRERNIEFNSPVDYHEEMLSEPGEEEQRFLFDPSVEAMYKVSFIDKVLSPCERILWTMRVIQEYSPTSIGRLLGKNTNTVSSSTSQAIKRVRTMQKSNSFQMAATIKELPRLWLPDVLAENSLFIERFSEPIKPEFTPDELKPLGLSLEELHTNYVISLIAPRWYDEGVSTVTPPSLLLTQKTDQEHMQDIYDKFKENPDDLPDEFPEECLVKVDIIGKDIRLRVEPLMQIFPDPDYMYGADHYLVLHSPRVKLPVAVATYDDDLSELSGDRKKWFPLYK